MNELQEVLSAISVRLDEIGASNTSIKDTQDKILREIGSIESQLNITINELRAVKRHMQYNDSNQKR